MQYSQFSHLSRRKKLEYLRRIALDALNSYPIDVAAVRFYAEHSNVLFKIIDTEGSGFLMKISRPGDHSYEETVAVLEWLSEVNRISDIDIIRVVPASSGDLAVTTAVEAIGETRICSVYEWIPGTILENRLSKNSARMWGALSANLHRFSAGYRHRGARNLKAYDRVFYWDEEVLFATEAERFLTPYRNRAFRRATDWVQGELDHLYSQGRPILIHSDLHPDNMKIHDGRLWALDVEDLIWGYPIQDIAIALFYIRTKSNYQSLYGAFKAGYESVIRWPITGADDLRPHFAARYLMFANYIVKLEDFEHDIGETLERYACSLEELMDTPSLPT